MLVVLLLILRSLVAGLGSRRELLLENLALRHQLQVALRTNPHPRLQPRDHLLWVWLRGVLPDGWRQHLCVVQPETVIRWHRKGWRLYWTWKPRTKVVAQASHRPQQPLDPPLPLAPGRPGPPSALAHLLANQLRGIWAADLFVVQTVSYRILYVFFLLRHDRREWIHFNVTASPTAAWIWRQVVEATPLGRQPTFLIHDRDAAYGADFDDRLARLGIAGVRAAPRAPKMDAIGERLVRTMPTECLDHIMVTSESHLQRVLTEFAPYYNRERPHRSLGLRSPIVSVPQGSGPVTSRLILGSTFGAPQRPWRQFPAASPGLTESSRPPSRSGRPRRPALSALARARSNRRCRGTTSCRDTSCNSGSPALSVGDVARRLN